MKNTYTYIYKGLAMACLMLLPSLSALSQTKTPQQELDSAVVLSAQQTDALSALPREHLHSTMIGVGTSNVLDTYLSPYNYTGTDMRLQRETMRMTGLCGSRVANQSLIDINAAINNNRVGNIDEYAGGIRYTQGWYYHVHGNNIVNPIQRSSSVWNVAVGLSASAYLGCVYIDRGGNNPAQAKADLMVDAGLMATYAMRLFHRTWLWRYQAAVPMLGAAFSPHYGQSYYEAFALGHYDSNVVFAHPFNMPSMRHRLTVDVPFRRACLRIGYVVQFNQSTFHSLKYHSYSHNFMIGFNKYFYSR